MVSAGVPYPEPLGLECPFSVALFIWESEGTTEPTEERKANAQLYSLRGVCVRHQADRRIRPFLPIPS